MKSTGITRPVDELGRVVIPKELRRTLDIDEKDRMEIFTDGDTIILRKYQMKCVLCGNDENLVTYRNKHVCRDCLAVIAGGAA